MKAPHRLLQILALFGLGTVLQAAPVNDQFVNAMRVFNSVPTLQDTTGASIEPGEVAHHKWGRVAYRSVWCKYVADFTGYIDVDTENSTDDTMLAVYRGTAIRNLTRLAQSDDTENGLFARVRLSVTKGLTYYIAVDAYAEGLQRLIVRPIIRFQPAIYEAPLRISLNNRPGVNDQGKFIATFTDKGSVSGRVLLGNKTYSFTSVVSVGKTFSVIIPRPNELPVVLVAGVTTDADGALTSELLVFGSLGDKSVQTVAYLAPKFTAAAPSSRAGRYHYIIDSVNGSAGYGVVSVVISPTGLCTGTGTLGEGTAFTFTAPILDNTTNSGSFCHHTVLYGGKGQVTANVDLEAFFNLILNRPEAEVSGNCTWFRPPATLATATFLPYGIEHHTLTLRGNLYWPPAAGTRFTRAFDAAGGNASFRVEIPGILQPVNPLTLSTTNLISVAGATLKVDVKTGWVTGTVSVIGMARPSVVRAVPVNAGGFSGLYGFTLGPVSGGSVTVTP